MSLNKIERDDLHWLHEHLLLMRNMIEDSPKAGREGGPPLLVRCESAIKLVAQIMERAKETT